MTILFVWLEGNASDVMAEFVLLASFQLKNKIVKMHDENKMYFLPDKSSISKDYTGGKVESIIFI